MNVTGTSVVNGGVEDKYSIIRFCLFLAVGATLATGQLYGIIAFLPQISGIFGAISLLGLPLFASGYAIGMLLIGSLSGIVGAKKIIVISLIGGAFLSIACAFSQNSISFLLLRFTEGLVMGGFPPAAFVATTQRIRPENRILANSAMVFGLLGSAGLVGLISHVMEESIGWRNGLVMYGVLLLLVALFATRLVGISPKNSVSDHPYQLIPVELLNRKSIFIGLCGASSMAAFVTTNSLAQQGKNPILSLIAVLCAVLFVLGASKIIIKRLPDQRLGIGLMLVCFGILLRLLYSPSIVISLAIITFGTSLVVPASIQQVTTHARKSISVAVACFTCMLFIGGALSGLIMTGIVPISSSLVAPVLIVSLVILYICSFVQLHVSIRDANG